MKNLFKTLLFVFLLTQTAFLQAQQPEQTKESFSFTVDQCVEYALTNQTGVLNSKLDENIAQQKVRDLLSAGLPQVNGAFSFQYNPLIPNAAVPESFAALSGGKPIKFGVDFTMSPSVQLNQLIFDGTYFVGLKAAREYVTLARISTERSKVDLTATISKGYYSVLVNTRRLELLKTNLVTLEASLKTTEALQKSGMAEKIDVDRLQVNLNNLQTEIDKTAQLVELSKYLLKFQMGMKQTADLKLTQEIQDMDFTPVLNGAPQEVDLEKRIEYKLLKQAMVLEEYNTKRYKVGYYPSVVAFAQWQMLGQAYNFSNFGESKTWSNSASIGLKINIPIFDGFKRDALIKQSQLARKRLDNDMTNLQLAADFEFTNAKISLANAIKTLEIQKRNMALAEEVYKIAQVKYGKGVGSNLEVVTAETSMKQAQMNYFNTLLEAYLAKIDLEKALGTLAK